MKCQKLNILVARLAKEQILPLVREMEAEHRIKDSVVDMLFENGVSFTHKLI